MIIRQVQQPFIATFASIVIARIVAKHIITDLDHITIIVQITAVSCTQIVTIVVLSIIVDTIGFVDHSILD